MLNNTIVCDLCAASTPEQSSLQSGFTRLNLQGEGPQKFRSLLGPTAPSHVDLCSECFSGFLGWAVEHRANHQAKAEPTPARAFHDATEEDHA